MVATVLCQSVGSLNPLLPTREVVLKKSNLKKRGDGRVCSPISRAATKNSDSASAAGTKPTETAGSIVCLSTTTAGDAMLQQEPFLQQLSKWAQEILGENGQGRLNPMMGKLGLGDDVEDSLHF